MGKFGYHIVVLICISMMTNECIRPLNAFKCSKTSMDGPETYLSCKYWLHISNASLMDSSLSLLAVISPGHNAFEYFDY